MALVVHREGVAVERLVVRHEHPAVAAGDRLAAVARESAPDAVHVERRPSATPLDGAVTTLALRCACADGGKVGALVEWERGKGGSICRRELNHIVVEPGHRDATLLVVERGDHRRQCVRRIDHRSSEASRMEVDVGVAHVDLEVGDPAKTHGERREVPLEEARIAAQKEIAAMQLGATAAAAKDKLQKQMEAEGVTFRTGVLVASLPEGAKVTNWAKETVSAQQLMKEFDAVLLAGGSEQSRDLPVPGRELNGVHFAMEFLPQQNKVVAGDKVADQIMATGKHVVVIGGGDTGSDCVGTSNRHGAKSISQFELLGKPDDPLRNPVWPYWPTRLRTSSSHEEGASRDWSIATKSFVGEGGKVKALKAVRLKWDGGKMSEVAGSESGLATGQCTVRDTTGLDITDLATMGQDIALSPSMFRSLFMSNPNRCTSNPVPFTRNLSIQRARPARPHLQTAVKF